MLKKIICLSIFFLLSGRLVNPVFANWTSWYDATSLGTTYSDFSPAVYMQSEDPQYATVNIPVSSAALSSFHFLMNEVKSGDDVNSVSINVRARRRYSGATSLHMRAYVIYDDLVVGNAATASSEVYDHAITSESWATYSFYFSNGEADTYVTDYFREHGFDKSRFTVVLSAYTGSGTETVLTDIDHVQVQLYTDTPAGSMNINSYVASGSAHLTYLNLSGDTATRSAEMTCDIKIFEDCTKAGVAGWKSDTPVAHVYLDPLYTDNVTIKNPDGTFQGYGFNPASSHWYADNVEVPFNPGATCTYPYETLCTTREMSCYTGDATMSGCVWTGTTTNMDSISNGGSPITYEQYSKPEPTDPLHWLVWEIERWFTNLITPNYWNVQQAWDKVALDIRTRAPFAYAYMIANFNFFDINPQTSFSFDIPVLIPGERYYYHVVMPDEMANVITFIQPFLKAFLWLQFALYLMKVWRKIFAV